MTFLFWNLYRKPLDRELANLAWHHEVDVLMLAECLLPPARILKALNRQRADYFFAPGLYERIRIFTRFSSEFIRPTFEKERLTIRRLTLPGLDEVLLVVMHGPSKASGWEEDSLAMQATEFADDIAHVEENAGHQRTILVGDFNMNPFETGMVAARGLHGVMSRHIAQRGSRTVQGKSYPFFYNPMWSLMGDHTPGPPGTHYHQRSRQKEFFWHMYDQVLIRPDLLRFFDNDELKILYGDGTNSFVDHNGRPNAAEFSDHLPVLFKLNL